VRINVVFLGPAKSVVPKENMQIELSEGARVRLLLSKLADSHPGISCSIFNPEQERLRMGAVLSIAGAHVTDLDVPLHDGQEVVISKMMPGG
jgi:hypothetical protein